MVGEVGLAENVEPGNIAHQVVIHPETPHRVVECGEDTHGTLISVLARDVVIHLKEVAVALSDGFFSKSLDGTGQIKINAEPTRSDTASLIADLLGTPGGDVARGEVAVARVLALKEVVALLFGNVLRGPRLALLLGNPDAAVVAKRLGHEGQLGLVVPGDRDAGRVDLRVAGIGEGGATLVGAPGGGHVRTAGIR